MFVWYVSNHKHNSILDVFGNVWERLGKFRRWLEPSGNVSERLGALEAAWNV